MNYQLPIVMGVMGVELEINRILFSNLQIWNFLYYFATLMSVEML